VGLLVTAAWLTGACSSWAQDWSDKLGFDLNTINPQGLYGPPEGLRAMSYEFCVPHDREYVVLAIDPSIGRCQRSPGRVGCSAQQRLCIGNTHQYGYRLILQQLSALDYIERIEPAWFE